MSSTDPIVERERDALDYVRREVDRHLRKYSRRIKANAERKIRDARGRYTDAEESAEACLTAAILEELGRDFRGEPKALEASE